MISLTVIVRSTTRSGYSSIPIFVLLRKRLVLTPTVRDRTGHVLTTSGFIVTLFGIVLLWPDSVSFWGEFGLCCPEMCCAELHWRIAVDGSYPCKRTSTDIGRVLQPQRVDYHICTMHTIL